MKDTPNGAVPPLQEVLQGMIAWRKTERDLERIAADPASLPGFDRLPKGVQSLAGDDPMSFWMLWQLSQEGVDLHAIDSLGSRLDSALRDAGWDGESPPSDEQFDTAEAELTRWAEARGS
jgi:hypothetical protein